MRSYISRFAAFSAVSISLAACGDHAPSAPVPPSTTTFGGHSTVLVANVPGFAADAVIGVTGLLPTSGGALESSQPSAQIPGLLATGDLDATSVGQGDASSSEASVSDLSLTIGGHTIVAQFVEARATAKCISRAPFMSGETEIDGLTIDGAAVTPSGATNQSVALSGGGQVILNEQSTTTGAITVTAIHVTIDGVGDVMVASAQAEVVCGSACPSNNGDFITGGGWIMVNGAKATFSISGGTSQSGLSGDLEWHDHGSGLTVTGTGVTGYAIIDATTRRITGNADIDGVPGTYTATVSDNGEPGRNDTIDLSLSNGYHVSGALGGGNLQLHLKPECP